MNRVTQKIFQLFSILITVITLLTSCGLSCEIQRLQREGKLPDSGDFPNTKWVCQEIDLCFFMLDYNEDHMAGEYTWNGEKYTVGCHANFGYINFYITESVKISDSSLVSQFDKNKYVVAEQKLHGIIETTYIYENGVITCTVIAESVEEDVPRTLTFKNAGVVKYSSSGRWQAEELDMSFDVIDIPEIGYLRGEIVLEGKRYKFHAMEIGNENYYEVNIVVEKPNNCYTEALAMLNLNFCDGKVVARVDWDVVNQSIMYPYWEYPGATITFYPAE